MENETNWKIYKVALPVELAAVTLVINTCILLSYVMVILTFRFRRLKLQHIYMLGLVAVAGDLMILIGNISVAVNCDTY